MLSLTEFPPNQHLPGSAPATNTPPPAADRHAVAPLHRMTVRPAAFASGTTGRPTLGQSLFAGATNRRV